MRRNREDGAMLIDAVDWVLGKLDYKVIRRAEYYSLCAGGRDVDIQKDRQFLEIFDRCKDFTMTGLERSYALYLSVRYVVEAGIEGDLVECGVWRGGSCMLMALTLQSLGATDRRIYLYDTFAGLTRPTDKDVNWDNETAIDSWRQQERADRNDWCYAPLEEVQRNLHSTGYPQDKLHYVRGPVEETVPGTSPDRIALLRLDTDWYESTHHLLQHFYPRLAALGVLLIDDYGHWQGAREAVDTYLAQNGLPLLLNRVDYTGRVALKPAR
jgi:O-methyltransferase